ncbi:hypothetical protein OK351_08215 [Glutamicibacter sp. MNS18]|uniref:hypothetical protein n=1 Tax=Glutamicibacter sp. MNS18 TaxID=2989817 RepID=UPI0022360AA0|nr:hypothetical protein [Glutamicibacter sp. MNS18]MCW4465485.1 hypothetical protein [Glutamicibacter sp. MNS18]
MQVKALLSLGILLGFGAVSTMASWTGTATSTSTISAATVALAIGDSEPLDSVTYELGMATMEWFPGMRQAETVALKNIGTVDSPYSIGGSMGAGELGLAMEISVHPGGTVSDVSETVVSCTGNAEYVKASGEQSFTSSQQPESSSLMLGTLAVGASETFCVQAELPIGSASSLQGQQSSMNLTFTATVGAS